MLVGKSIPVNMQLVYKYVKRVFNFRARWSRVSGKFRRTVIIVRTLDRGIALAKTYTVTDSCDDLSTFYAGNPFSPSCALNTCPRSK